jgi:tetratricopeptide (TPR) repeat protein
MALFYGLYLYEVVLLVLGIVFFVVLLLAFGYYMKQNRSITPLLAFFVVAIAMIGYPSIKSIQIKDDMVTIEKQTQRLEENPTDASARTTLQETVAKVEQRPISNAPALTTIAKAQFALGNDAQAASTADKALQSDPQATEAKNLKSKIDEVNRLHVLATTVEANPADANARAQLQRSVAGLSGTKLASPKALSELARGQAALGDHEKALETANTAVTISPASTETRQLRDSIKIQSQVARP